MNAPPTIYGLLAEFDDAQSLVHAARRTHGEGYRRIDAYSPFPIEELPEALGVHGSWIPLITLLGGIVGGVTGFGMQYYAAVVSYPVNVGGRPLLSWPAFIPVTFELTILGAALFSVLGMLALNGLPMPYHPVFHVPRFSKATRDGFFLCIEATDPLFDVERTTQFLRELSPSAVTEVPH